VEILFVKLELPLHKVLGNISAVCIDYSGFHEFDSIAKLFASAFDSSVLPLQHLYVDHAQVEFGVVEEYILVRDFVFDKALAFQVVLEADAALVLLRQSGHVGAVVLLYTKRLHQVFVVLHRV